MLPHITNKIPYINTQHGYKINHSTDTALHNININIATGFSQKLPPARKLTPVMSKALDTVNIHKLIYSNIPNTSIKLIANYIKCKDFQTFRNTTSTRCQFKTGVQQEGVLTPTLFNIYTAEIYYYSLQIHNS